MPLKQTWLAVSLSRSTIMLAPSPTNLVVPPMRGHGNCHVNIELANQARFDPAEMWVAITCEDGIH